MSEGLVSADELVEVFERKAAVTQVAGGSIRLSGPAAQQLAAEFRAARRRAERAERGATLAKARARRVQDRERAFHTGLLKALVAALVVSAILEVAGVMP